MSYRCQRCQSEFHPHITECPKCKLLNMSVASWIPESVKERYLEKFQKKQNEIKKKTIKDLFKKILKKYGIKPKSLEIKTTHESVFEILSNDIYHKNIELKFNPLIVSYYTTDEIISCLHYEVFLLLTMKGSSKILAPDVSPELVDFLTDFTVLFNNYLAFVEYSSYFKENSVFKELKINQLANFSAIIYNLRQQIKTQNIPSNLYPLSVIIKILQDVMYFIIFDKQRIEQEANENNFTNIIRLFQWIIDDFEIIRSAKLPLKSMFKTTQLIGGLVLSIDPLLLILKNQMLFGTTTDSQHNRLVRNNPDETTLIIKKNWDTHFSEFKEQSLKHFRSMNEKISKLKNQLTRTNPAEFLNFLTLTCAIPGNEVYGVRLEFLFKLVLTIPENQFSNEKLTLNHVQNIFSLIDDFGFDALEDYEPTRTKDYPPLWILGTRYRILSGLQFRPYEHWKDVVAMYFPVQEQFKENFGYNPITVIQEALGLQNQLYDYLDSIEPPQNKINGILVPPLESIQEWNKIIQEWIQSNSFNTYFTDKTISLGQEFSDEQLLSPEEKETFYKFCFIKIGQVQILIPQHTIHESLKYNFVKDTLNKIDTFRDKIITNTQKRIFSKLLRIFDKDFIFRNFSISDSPKFDFGIIFDHDKLFLLRVIHTDLISISLEDALKQVYEDCENLENKIEFNAEVKSNDTKIGTCPDVKMEIIPLIVIKTSDLSVFFPLPDSNYLKRKVSWYGENMDFLSLISDVKDGMTFLTFLRRMNSLMKETAVISLSSLDRYAYYIQNHESFLQSGIPINIMELPLGTWEQFHISKIKKKPDFQPRLISDEYDDFWEVDPISDQVLDIRNLEHSTLGRIILLKNGRDIWITSTVGMESFVAEEKRAMFLLVELIPYRITRTNALENLFSKMKVDNKSRVRFSTIPTSAIQRNDMEDFQGALSVVSEQNPIATNPCISPIGKDVIFPIVFSLEGLVKLFENGSLEAEKTIVNILISGIVNHFNQTEISNDELIKDCMNELFENGRPAFNFMTIHDPMFTKHSSGTNYQKTRDADIQEITRQTAKFLNEESIQPGTYEGENARKIIDKILEFRLQKLDDELKKYNIVKLSPFLLRMQGNVIEARGIAQKRAMNDMPQIEEFDPISWHHEKAGELSKVGETIRYISERALQLNPHGDDYLTQEKWLEIQAMGELIVYITSVRNVIYYEVGVFKLRISDDYWYEIVGEDTENLAQHMANFNMFMLKSSKNSIHLNSEKETEFYQKINEPFKEEFKVTFESFLKILLDCIEFPLTKDQHNAIVSEQGIIAFIKKQNPEMPEDEIIAGLSLASISSEELKSIQIFATDTRNRKVRSIVKPLIKLEDSGTKYVINSWLTRVSRFQWSDYVDKGHLPFKVSYITTSGSLEITLNDIQHEVAKELENATGKIVSNFADVYDKNIKEDHRCFSSLSNFPGELDVLGIFVKHKKVILFEVKHANINFSALDFSNEIKKFTNSNGYQNILLNKKSFLEQNLQEILRYYEIEMEGEWTVETMFVSNTFHFNISNLQIPIVLLDDLEKMLSPIHS